MNIFHVNNRGGPLCFFSQGGRMDYPACNTKSDSPEKKPRSCPVLHKAICIAYSSIKSLVYINHRGECDWVMIYRCDIFKVQWRFHDFWHFFWSSITFHDFSRKFHFSGSFSDPVGTLFQNRLVSQMRPPLAACREPTGKLWQLCKVLCVFEHKTPFLLTRAPFTCIVVFWHISYMPP